MNPFDAGILSAMKDRPPMATLSLDVWEMPELEDCVVTCDEGLMLIWSRSKRQLIGRATVP